MRRRDLPPDLPNAFSRSMAYERGVSRSRLRARDLARPFHGIHVVTAVDPPETPEDILRDRAAAYATLMGSHEFFSHAAAALEWGLPLPRDAVDPDALDVSVLWPHRAPRTAGIAGHAIQPALVSVREAPSGLRVTSPASTWATLAPALSVRDLVAIGDALVREPRRRADPPALATPAALAAVVAAGRRPGIQRLRAALPRIRPRVDSRTETHLRLLLIDAGLPEPVTGCDVYDDELRIARVDLAYPAMRVAIEYEGEHHLTDPQQWAEDIRRRERLEAAGWMVIRVTKDDLYRHPQQLVERVRSALARRP